MNINKRLNMKVSVDLDLDIKITGVSQDVAEYAKDRFDDFYDANGLLFLDMEEEDGDFNILTNWSAGYSNAGLERRSRPVSAIRFRFWTSPVTMAVNFPCPNRSLSVKPV